jgi:hypothetical protein
MPIHRSNGGYKFGTHGKTYKGKGARRKALRQAAAIKISEQRAAGRKHRQRHSLY